MWMVNCKLSGDYTQLTLLLASQIITFDNYGVSGHCNHCDVHRGVRSVDLDLFVLSLRACICWFCFYEIWILVLLCRKLLQNSSQQVEAWELVSYNIYLVIIELLVIVNFISSMVVRLFMTSSNYDLVVPKRAKWTKDLVCHGRVTWYCS